MKKLWMVLAAILLIAATAEARTPIGVAVTIAPLAQMVEQVGGDRVAVTVIVPPGASPHTYEPTPGQLRGLSRSRLYVKVGSGVEFELVWLDKILAVNRQLAVCDSSRGVLLIGAQKDGDHSGEGHSHPEASDPHIWMSLNNAVLMTQNIRDSLVMLDPANEVSYRANADAYIARLRALHNRIEGELTKVRTRKFMVFHPSFGYFASEFHLDQIPVEAGGKEPSARDLTRLIQKAKAQNITVIFTEPQFSSRSAQIIASAIGGRVVMIDPLAGDYLQNMEKMAQAVIGVLK